MTPDPRVRIGTARLQLREMTDDDLPDLRAILHDPQAMTAYNGAFTTHYRRVDMPRLAFALDRGAWTRRSDARPIGSRGVVAN